MSKFQIFFLLQETSSFAIIVSCCFQMVEVDIPQSLFEEQGRQLYAARLLEIQVVVTIYFYLVVL